MNNKNIIQYLYYCKNNDKNIFKGYKSGIYVDVGAHDGITINNTFYFQKNNKWNGINIYYPAGTVITIYYK